MNNQEMLLVMKGTKAQKLALFDELMLKVTSGEDLLPGEVSVLEFLKREVTSDPEIISLSANLLGKASSNV